jgi:hypothetical protein
MRQEYYLDAVNFAGDQKMSPFTVLPSTKHATGRYDEHLK